MLAIRLPQSIEKRLEKLARRTGRTKTYYVREAILEHLEDLEDMYLAEGALERIRSGEDQTIPLKDVVKRHGLQGCATYKWKLSRPAFLPVVFKLAIQMAAAESQDGVGSSNGPEHS